MSLLIPGPVRTAIAFSDTSWRDSLNVQEDTPFPRMQFISLLFLIAVPLLHTLGIYHTVVPLSRKVSTSRTCLVDVTGTCTLNMKSVRRRSAEFA